MTPPRHDVAGDGVTVGVDVGGTSTRIVVFSGAGEQIEASTAPTPLGGPALVHHLGDGIASSVAGVAGRLTRVGVGVPGGVDDDGTVSMALNIGIEQPWPLGSLLESRLGVPVRIENDVNAAALGAHVRLGAATGTSLAYLSIGTGFAAGFVVGGEIVRGALGAAGEIGHIPLPGGDAPCVCGQIGCIETVASGRALIARMRSAGIEGRAGELWSAADAGHPQAIAIRDDAVAALAWCCQVVLLMLDVDRIVIGGGVGIGLGPRLIEPIAAALGERERMSPFLASIGMSRRVTLSPSGIEVGALGADRSARRTERASGVGT
jgi:predicted NBD/HSP70 family sugar kinase